MGDREYAPQVQQNKMSEKQYKNRIRDAMRSSEDKNLPFSIIPPKRKAPPSNRGYHCGRCGELHWVNKNTYMVQCTTCNELVKVSDMTPVECGKEVSTEIGVTQFKDVAYKPGPFTKDPTKDTGKGKWV